MATTIRFSATLKRPANGGVSAEWTFLRLPAEASAELPSRGMVSVEGTFGGVAFQATLEPDGEGGHWLKVKPQLSEAANVVAGDRVTLEVAPMTVEPEPEIPDDLQQALESDAKAMDTWTSITAVARRDWVHWITSGKKAETRVKRIEVAMSKMSAGNRRPCCFDRSGMYSKSLSCPIAEE